MKKIFIDGKEGTTGLKIYNRLALRDDIEVITLSEENRKDINCRKEALNKADVAFLCLPDAAAIEAVSLVENSNTVIIDTSTAHRTNDGWAYGFPELSVEHDKKIANSKRIAVPGCHAGGFIALIYPLIEAGIIDKSELLSCFSITGYSGGGKKMIAQYEDEGRDELLSAPRQYAITQQHKHLKEMKSITGLENFPIFSPVVSDFFSGMQVTVPIFKEQLKQGKGIDDIKAIYKAKYSGPIVSYDENADNGGFLETTVLAGKDSMKVTVCGNEDRILLVALYDNLGKGASGAALECLNIVLGKDKDFGLLI